MSAVCVFINTEVENERNAVLWSTCNATNFGLKTDHRVFCIETHDLSIADEGRTFSGRPRGRRGAEGACPARVSRACGPCWRGHRSGNYHSHRSQLEGNLRGPRTDGSRCGKRDKLHICLQTPSRHVASCCSPSPVQQTMRVFWIPISPTSEAVAPRATRQRGRGPSAVQSLKLLPGDF